MQRPVVVLSQIGHGIGGCDCTAGVCVCREERRHQKGKLAGGIPTNERTKERRKEAYTQREGRPQMREERSVCAYDLKEKEQEDEQTAKQCGRDDDEGNLRKKQQ